MNYNKINTNDNSAENAAIIGQCAEVKTLQQSFTEQASVTPSVIEPGPVVVKIPV